MLIQFKQFIEGISGQLGGTNGIVFYNRSTLRVARTAFQPANPQTASQVAVRNFLTQISAAFGSLTAGERSAWDALAAAAPVQTFNGAYNAGAMAMYQRVNFYRLLDSQAITDTAPTDSVPAVVSDVSAAIVAADLVVTVTHNDAAGTNKFAVYVTGPMPTGQRNPQPGDYRLIAGVATGSIVDEGASPQAVTVASASVPFTIVATDIIGIKVLPTNDGYFPGTPFTKKVTVT